MQLAERPSQQFMLSTATYNKVSDIMQELVMSTRADFALFCDVNGNPITHHGKNVNMDSCFARIQRLRLYRCC